MDSTAAKGVVYYQLRQWDKNGASTYSAIVSVNAPGETFQAFKLYPNPRRGLCKPVLHVGGGDPPGRGL